MKKRVKITLIVKRHLTFVVYLNLVIDDLYLYHISLQMFYGFLFGFR